MKLKKLILAGFKSFADRTEFDFDDGISCVVGPNGCGKSNIVDAIKWVLGEQSAKSLRGGEMLDVIFNGSSSRNKSSQASVTLVFDNDTGLLQPSINGEIQATETVSVTRRLFRSGQSEYLINQQPARLRDIKDMFLDTGVGTNAYSIIEQGRVSQFLQATQEERRAFFDEAAGISRYKQRKKEALRKLDRVEQNLLRLHDILAEVEKRLRSIKLQAGKARNYQTYSEHLKELRSLFFLARYHTLRGRRKDQEAHINMSADKLAAATGRVGQLEAAQASTEVESGQLDQQARDLQATLAGLHAQITTLQERVEMQTKRVEELNEQILTGSHRCEELEAKIDECAKDHAAGEAELTQVTRRVEELQNACEEQRQAHADGEKAIHELQGRLEEEKTGVMDLLRRTSQLHNDVHTIGLRKQNLSGERDRVSRRADELAESLQALVVEHAQEKTRLRDILEVIEDSQAKLEEVKSSSLSLIDTEKDVNRQLAETREQRSSVTARMHTLREMRQKLEGVAGGAKRVLEAVARGEVTCVHGLLGDFIETDVRHAKLVEAALGGADQRLLAVHSQQVRAEIDKLEECLGPGGAAEVICLDRVNDLHADEATVQCPQAVGRVLDMVRFDAWLEPTMWRLLGHTLLVRNLADAMLANDITPEGYRFVTVNGEVLEPDGRIRLGATNQGAGRIAQRSELSDLQQRLTALERDIERLQKEGADVTARREHIEEQLHNLRTALYEANFEKTESEKNIASLEEKITEQQRQAPLLAVNLKDIEKDIEEAIRTEHETKDKVAQLETNKTRHDAAIESLEAELNRTRERQQELAERRTEMRAQLAAAEQKKVALRESTDRLARQREGMEQELTSARSNIELDRRRRDEAQEQITAARGEVDELYARQQEYQAEAADIEESRRGLTERLAEIRRALTEQRGVVEAIQREQGDHRVKLGEIDAHIGDLINRAADEMGMNLTELYPSYEHDDQRDWQAVEDEINDLRGKIERLGNVNLDAITEQEELEQRHEFLNGQMQDIENAQKQLDDLIRRLNKESRERFVETFTAVRENFQTLFRKLFGGGKADIMLTDPEDVLESGIEIVARPPGKELRSISLLSGGEKTMAALAMIFSFFQAKPSPFCLLDEVDAALDEANNERYNALVKGFVGKTQFIMITHAKRTMSIGNVLYGVTMQEPGVSRQINVRFEEADQLEETLQPA
ncbi:MAG: chromosome segregation protein SMC [Phycisphaerae bacterium]|nr:chromosome segregation protein SMC [Phycisphaerae bacterium]